MFEIAKYITDVVSVGAKTFIWLIKLLSFCRSSAGFLLGRAKQKKKTNFVEKRKKIAFVLYITQDFTQSHQSSRGIVHSTLLLINQAGSTVKLFPIQEQSCFGQKLYRGLMESTFLIWNFYHFLTDRCL